jgi:hypothetical protein
MRADEEGARLMEANPSFIYQCFQRVDEITGYRYDPFLATFATQEHLWSRAIQLEVISIDADGLRNAGPGARQEKQQRPIAPAARRLLIRRLDESINFVLREMMRPICDLLTGMARMRWAMPNDAGSFAAT